MTSAIVLSVLAATAFGSPAPRQTADDIAVVYLGTSQGAPQHLASGFIYGVPDTRGQIPAHFWTDLDINGCRTGGAQLDAPSRGWIYGLSEYEGRFASSLSNYQECREYGAEVSWLAHDIWGTDHANDSTVWPGDDGQWDSYDQFVTQLIEDIYDNDALEGTVYEIWNEPDISIFWARDSQQWVDLYVRTHKLIRADSRFDSMKIAGPSLAYRPAADNEWWTSWLSQVAGNDTIPDYYTYHLEGDTTEDDNDPTYTNSSLSALLDKYGLPEGQVNVNEYANFAEQVPAGYAWWIAALERFDFIGLLGNWASGTTLHDLFANLITKESDPYDYAATDYTPAPGYWVYHYYATNMTGTRVKVDRSGDGILDTYATVGDDRVRLLVGARIQTGTWYVTVDDLESVGLPASGSLTIDTWGFDGSDVYAPQAAPGFRNSVAHDYTDGTLTFAIYQEDTHTAWAFEFDVGS